MTETKVRFSEAAQKLDDAQRNANATGQFDDNEFDVADAYEIQSELISLRRSRGEQRCGIKMGFTSRAKMQQMGVDDLIWGRLTDSMRIENQSSIEFNKFAGKGFIHPRVEPEICFLLKKDLPGSISREQACDAIESIAPALEVIDSRYEAFKFSLPDVIADNASSSAFCIGPWQPPELAMTKEFSNLGIVMTINGLEVQFGSSAAILGDPLESLVNAARLSASAGEPLKAGWIVLAGAATAAEPLRPGDSVKAEIQDLGSVEFRC